jgi:N6-L-threonylcarbamoyladenine synthase
MENIRQWEKLGETQDDAAGEAFDKVAKMLGLPYPGGPEVEKMAREGNASAIAFPRPMLHSGDYNFSFSGLKTSVLYHLREHPDILKSENSALKTDVCASFQKAALDVLCIKTFRAAEEYGAASVMVCGGVAGNVALRAALKSGAEERGIAFHAPDMRYNTDNAVMIAAASYLGTAYPTDAPQSNLNI